jgi:succinylarginine dihydrolase
MKLLHKLGVPQGVIPPQERPHIPTLKKLGFTGKDSEILQKVRAKAPELLIEIVSSSSMWAANAASVTPSVDAKDKKVHFTPANLSSKFHRSIEAEMTGRILKILFANPLYFVHHSPLPYGRHFADEGSANHTRFFSKQSSFGVHLFVYGRRSLQTNALLPEKYPARQTLEAQQAIARQHGIANERVCTIQQNPEAIDAGVFHNDVISVGSEKLFLYHEKAFVGGASVLNSLKEQFHTVTGDELVLVEVKNSKVSLETAVQTYLFNSQLITTKEGFYALVAPLECRENPQTLAQIEEWIHNPVIPLKEVHYTSLKESMQNGGGPACLRLRVPLLEKELSQVHPKVFLDETLYRKLRAWIEKHYRDRLEEKDLGDPKLLEESRAALDELTQLLELGNLYDFQN